MENEWLRYGIYISKLQVIELEFNSFDFWLYCIRPEQPVRPGWLSSFIECSHLDLGSTSVVVFKLVP